MKRKYYPPKGEHVYFVNWDCLFVGSITIRQMFLMRYWSRWETVLKQKKMLRTM